MATTADIKKGLCIRFNHDIYKIIEFLHVNQVKGLLLYVLNSKVLPQVKFLTTLSLLVTKLKMYVSKLVLSNICMPKAMSLYL